MDRAFVTGGSGFVGGRLIERLVAEGVGVRALARSEEAADRVRALGAQPVTGDLGDSDAWVVGAYGCEVLFHAAAKLGDWGRPREFWEVNVLGTRRVIAAARRAGVRRVVHVGTEAVLLAGEPLVAADESMPVRTDSPVLYCATKAHAEQAVLTAPPDIEAVVVRPRFVWGRGDTTLLPRIAARVRSGQWAWIGGGRHLTATTHVDNTVHGLLLAATRGEDRRVWFVTDGPPIAFREMIERMLATQGLRVPDRSAPRFVARALAAGGEAAWRVLRLPGSPPLTRFAVWAASQECTIDDSRAQRELGYEPVVSREEGFAAMAGAPSSA
jgi:nucleoside-diphosphate-sugar epimerase